MRKKSPSHISASDLLDRLELALGVRPIQSDLIAKNYGFSVWKVQTNDARFAVKTGMGEVAGHLKIEANSLRDIAATGCLPTPKIIHAEDDLLVLEWVETTSGPILPIHEVQAAEALAQLHAQTPEGSQRQFGYAYDTTIGGLSQPNPSFENWADFYGEARLLPFAKLARERQLIDLNLVNRIEALSARLKDHLPEPARPAFIHGDAWYGNILINNNMIAAFIDPAPYCASPEIELAYVTMHNTFGQVFFDTYSAISPLEPEFFSHRIDILNIYPNLVHVLLCGPDYIAPITRTLDRVGI